MLEKWGRKIKGNQFGIDPNGFSSYDEYRRACKRESDRYNLKRRYKENPDKWKRANKKYRESNKEKIAKRRQTEYKGIEKFKGVSKNERYVGVVLCDLFPENYIQQQYHIEYIPEWITQFQLKGKRAFIDFVIEDAGLAVEFNGPHHYGPIYYVNDESYYSQVKKRDGFIEWYCRQHDWQLIKIDGRKYKRPKHIRTYLELLLANQ